MFRSILMTEHNSLNAYIHPYNNILEKEANVQGTLK